MLKFKRITADRTAGRSLEQNADEFFKSVTPEQIVHIECLTEANTGNLRGIVVLYQGGDTNDR